jgi:hypothetical protein
MDEKALLQRITVNPRIFCGKPVVRGLFDLYMAAIQRDQKPVAAKAPA